MLKSPVPHFYPKMHLDAYWRPFCGNPSRLKEVANQIERALVSSYRQTIYSNFSSIFTRFRYIAALLLQHAVFPTTPLVSPKFPHVPMEIG